MESSLREVRATDLATRAGLAGRPLLTRPVGERFRTSLRAELEAAGPGHALVVSFAGAGLMDGSFADEVFGSLAAARSRREGPAACLALRDVDAASLDNLEMALTSRPGREPGALRNCAIAVIGQDGDVRLVGKAEGHVEETFAVLRERGRLTARDMAEARGLEIAAASNRLKTLSDLGLATRSEIRDRHGKQFVYAWLW